MYDRGLEAFLQKPGGAVLMLNLFVSGKLAADTAVGLMNDLASDLVSQTRDGDERESDDSLDDIPGMLKTAYCLSACLDLTFSDALWTGPATCRPHYDLKLNCPSYVRSNASAYAYVMGVTRLQPYYDECRMAQKVYAKWSWQPRTTIQYMKPLPQYRLRDQRHFAKATAKKKLVAQSCRRPKAR